MIKLPKDFIAADYNFDFAIPKAKIETKRMPGGSFVLRAGYETNEIEEFVQHAAREMNEKVEAAIMDELLRLNGYVPERTCHSVVVECNDGLQPPFRVFCSECEDEWGFTPVYCPNCGAKWVKNDY